MLVGYNTNITYKGQVYHIQTEDSGIKNPHIITLLYLKGTILSSKKTSYAELAGDPDYREKVRELMKEQHKSMMKELIRGKHTAPGETSEEAPPAAEAHPDKASAQAPAETVLPEKEMPQEIPAAEPAKPEPAAAAGAATKSRIEKSLDDILLDFILKREE